MEMVVSLYLHVLDLEKAEDFYVNKLELFDVKVRGSSHMSVSLRDPAASFELLLWQIREPAGSQQQIKTGIQFILPVRDLAAALQALDRNNIEHTAPYELPYMQLSTVQDPFGTEFALRETFC